MTQISNYHLKESFGLFDNIYTSIPKIHQNDKVGAHLNINQDLLNSSVSRKLTSYTLYNMDNYPITHHVYNKLYT